jgi:DNA-binding transcriptional MerR regulator
MPARPAATPAREPGKGALLSIGQVLAKLSPEFPDLTPSKLRFLEEQQLVAPDRTESGYRKFSPRDVDRLRFVLTLQRDHYLPLKVIRSHLAELEAGRMPALPLGSVPLPSMLATERRLSREELLHESGASAGLLNDAVSASLVPAAETFGEDALAVVRALVELQRSRWLAKDGVADLSDIE